MAQRDQQKLKRATSRKPGSADTGISSAVERLEAEMRALAAERDRLAGELDAAKARITELQDAQTAAVNRIDWVIDSMKSILEGGR